MRSRASAAMGVLLGLGLWLSYYHGIVAARALAELCEHHSAAWQWQRREPET
jgi:hypothetical protein